MKEVKLSELRQNVENGLKVEDLAKIYELPKSQVKLLLKQADLKIRRTPKENGFKLVDDTAIGIVVENTVTQETVQETVVPTLEIPNVPQGDNLIPPMSNDVNTGW